MTLWEPELDSVGALQRMLANVEWGKALHPAQAQCIQEAADWVLAGFTENPLVEWGHDSNRLKAAICLWAEQILHWVRQAQDHDMIERVRLAEETVARVQLEVDFDDE